MPQPPPPPSPPEQGKPPQRQRSQPGSRGHHAAPTRASPLRMTLMEGGPHAQQMGTPPPSSQQHPARDIVPAMFFAGRHARSRPPPPGCLAAAWGALFGFYSPPLSLLAGSLLCISNSNWVTPGDNSAATRPGSGTTWTRFRHLASRKEGGRQRGSIPSAPKANTLHRLTPAAVETCRNDPGFKQVSQTPPRVSLLRGVVWHPPVPPSPRRAVG